MASKGHLRPQFVAAASQPIESTPPISQSGRQRFHNRPAEIGQVGRRARCDEVDIPDYSLVHPVSPTFTGLSYT